MKIAIIGGGILGLSLGYRLSKKGYHVTILEKNLEAGGQARSLKIDNFTIEQYYHCILGADSNLISLIKELELEEKLFFVDATSGAYFEKKVYSISSPTDFLLFPPLSFFERLRLGLGTQYIRLINDWKKLESQSLKMYLEHIYGKSVYDKFWRYLFKARFDMTVEKLPATYLWSRIQRYSPSDSKLLTWDKIGSIKGGGYYVLINKLVEEIEKNGGEVLLNKKVKRLVVEEKQINGVELDNNATIEANRVISTIPFETFKQLFPEGYENYLKTLDIEYMDIICVMLISKISLTPYHTLYILDEESPFTGIIEITNIIDPSDVGGKHVIYLSKYVSHGNPYFKKSTTDLMDDFTYALKNMFPQFELSNIEKKFCFKEEYVEPTMGISPDRKLPPIETPINGLFLINSTQVYPKIPHCDALIEMADQVINKLELVPPQ